MQHKTFLTYFAVFLLLQTSFSNTIERTELSIVNDTDSHNSTHYNSNPNLEKNASIIAGAMTVSIIAIFCYLGAAILLTCKITKNNGVTVIPIKEITNKRILTWVGPNA